MSDAAGRGMDQAGHAGHQLAGVVRQVVRGGALRRQAGDVFQVDAVGHLGGSPCRHCDILGIGSELLAIHDTVAGLEVGDLIADSNDGSGAAAADLQRCLVRRNVLLAR